MKPVSKMLRWFRFMKWRVQRQDKINDRVNEWMKERDKREFKKFLKEEGENGENYQSSDRKGD